MPGKRCVARRRAIESGAFRSPTGGVLVARSTWYLCALAAIVAVVVLALPAAGGAAVRQGSACVARHVVYVEGQIEVHYRPGCTGHDEPEAFDAMLRRAGTPGPLVMHGGDTITVHYYGTPARDGAHIDVVDLTTGQHGSIVLNNKRTGAMNPAFDRQKIGNALGWGIV